MKMSFTLYTAAFFVVATQDSFWMNYDNAYEARRQNRGGELTMPAYCKHSVHFRFYCVGISGMAQMCSWPPVHGCPLSPWLLPPSPPTTLLFWGKWPISSTRVPSHLLSPFLLRLFRLHFSLFFIFLFLFRLCSFRKNRRKLCNHIWSSIVTHENPYYDARCIT